jgi:hypothetical protein
LHAAVLEVDGLDETARDALEELVGEDLGRDGLAVDEVADDLEKRRI